MGLLPSTLTDRSEVRNMRECNGQRRRDEDGDEIGLKFQGRELDKNAQGKSSAKTARLLRWELYHACRAGRQEPGDATI